MLSSTLQNKDLSCWSKGQLVNEVSDLRRQLTALKYGNESPPNLPLPKLKERLTWRHRSTGHCSNLRMK